MTKLSHHSDAVTVERDDSRDDLRAELDLASAPWPFFAEDEIKATEAVLRSGKVNYWTGPNNDQFEKAFAARFGTRHAIALGNGTLAIDLALIAMGIGPGDDVIVTPRSYFASVSSVVLAGANPIFADVDLDSQNITAATIEPVLTPATKLIMPVHLGGWPCDMPQIMDLATSRGVGVLEDCAQAHGATVQGQSIGSFGDMAAFSFCQDKIMTTGGEGGMLLTDQTDLWDKAWSFKDHGKSLAAIKRDDHPPGFRWVHESFGSNYRLTDMQAAIGHAQLRKLDDWVDTRRAHASIYLDTLGGLSALRTPVPAADTKHAYYKFYSFVKPEALREGWDRDRIMVTLNDMGVPCFGGSCAEIYREKALRDRGLGPAERLPNARALGETSLMLVLHPTLRPEQIALMADAVARVVRLATR